MPHLSSLRLALAAAALTLPALAQSGIPAPIVPITPDPRLAAIHAAATHARTPSQVAISPDAKLLAWSIPDGDAVTLHLATLADATAKDRILTPDPASTCTNSYPVWSPDSQLLAFTSSCTTSTATKDPQPQIFLWSRATNQIRQLTHLTGIFHQAAFSPDGESLAFLFVENASRSAGALAAMKPWSGVIGEDGIEVQRVYAVDVPSGLGNWISASSTLHVYEFTWSPDSRNIAYIAANTPGENNWWVAKLYTQSVGFIPACDTSGPIHECKIDGAPMGVPQVIFDPVATHSAMHGLQLAVPRWSPDGKRIAFIGGLMSDQGSTGGDIWTVPATGGDPTDITPNIDSTPTFITWLTPDILALAEDRRGHSLIAGWHVDRKSPGPAFDLGEVNITGGPIKMAISGGAENTIAIVKSGHDQAPEIFAGHPNEGLKQITHLNDTLKPPAHTESIEWTSPVAESGSEVFHVQGWLTYPTHYDPAKKYPLIVSVHGGPSASASAFYGGSDWAQLGYFVFAPNPRGSFGQGEAFTAANRKDFGYGDLRDILAGMDAVEQKVSIDKSREGLMGWSYGGFMTMFAVTQTHRFQAAVAGAGVSNWQSYYGENSIDQWMVPFFGATVYDDPAVYAKSSAINFIKNVTTPTLVVVGDRDGECPAPQSFEFWHALRAENVTTQLVVYPNEGHGFRDPAHSKDLEAREVAWFTKYMPAKDSPAN